ncbi:hypothetical protein LINGRAHAP2_LOCUS14105, partial [Linum grandiflorum]
FIPLSVPKVDGIIPPRIERIFLTGVAVLQTPVIDERNNTVQITRLDSKLLSKLMTCLTPKQINRTLDFKTNRLLPLFFSL